MKCILICILVTSTMVIGDTFHEKLNGILELRGFRPLGPLIFLAKESFSDCAWDIWQLFLKDGSK